MDNLDFVAIANGLEVSFRVLTKVPAKAIFDWDFGDDKGSVYDVKQPTYTYEKSGFYTVALNITNSEGLNLNATKTIIVNTESKTTLTDSIYNLINYYIPSEISDGMSSEEKAMYITPYSLGSSKYIFRLLTSQHVLISLSETKYSRLSEYL